MKNSPFFKEEAEKRKKAEDLSGMKYAALMQDLRDVFGSEAGGRVLNWIFGICKTGTSVFTGNSQTFYNSGQQDIGHIIENKIIEADPAIYARLLAEKSEKLKARTRIQTQKQ